MNASGKSLAPNSQNFLQRNERKLGSDFNAKVCISDSTNIDWLNHLMWNTSSETDAIATLNAIIGVHSFRQQMFTEL